MSEISEIPNPVEQPELNQAIEPIVIETDQPGLVLVQLLTIDDDKEYLKLQNDNIEHIAEFGNVIDPTLEEVTKRRTEKGRVRFGIRKDGILVGMEGYTPSKDAREAEVSILLGKDAVGHGYATAALKAMSAYVGHKFERVYAEVDPNNEKSIRLCERAGYILQNGLIQADWGSAAVLEFRK